MLLGRKGRNQQVPELSATIPYDAFKVDVYALGDVFAKEFVDVSLLNDLRHGLTTYLPISAEVLWSRQSAAACGFNEALESL